MTIKFRSFEPTDAKLLPDLFLRALRTVYPDFQSGSWTQDLNDIPNRYVDLLVGLDDDTIVAMGAIRREDDETCELKRVVVEPSYQGKGIGQQVVDALETRAKQLGFSQVILDTTIKQVAAQHLYEKNGYRQVGRNKIIHPAGFPTEVISYNKRLH
ncbi:MAG TPA: GNAT family N-acetyltransferase [Candidatus Nanoarchaeia archaeon]|nr:GNAT family N-acetyltransferase [Candidatus Nanoarchaeia archaeon]